MGPAKSVSATHSTSICSSSSSSSSLCPFDLWTATLVVSLWSLLLGSASGLADKEAYTSLHKTLFDNYSVDIRPVNDYSSATELYMALFLLSIVEVNEKDQTLKTNTLLEIEWEDEYLSWDPSDHENITDIMKQQKNLWLPDLVVSNTVSSQKQLGYDKLKLRITRGGGVVWNPSGVFETACDIDVTYYPFDTQVCSIEFQTAMSLNSEVIVYIDKTEPIDLSSFSQNGLWRLLTYSAENNVEDSGDSKTKIRFKLQLQRRRSYYILNLIMPIFLLSLTSSLTFALPSDSGEKVGLSITVLLAFAVYLTLVTDAMPTTSVQVSVVTVYLILLLSVSSASVVLTVFILSLHHRPPSRPVIGCMASTIPTLRTLLFMSPIPPEELEEDSRKADGAVVKDDASTGGKKHAAVQNMPLPSFRKSPSKPLPPNAVSPGEGLEGRSGKPLVSRSKVKAVSGRRVGETLDKFIFVLFTFISLAATVVCLIILFVGAENQASSTKLA